LRVVIDTNVVMSAAFFGGGPYRILKAWHDGKVEIAVSEAILEEYPSVGDRLSREFPGVEVGPFLDLLSIGARVYRVPDLPERVCQDPDDDKFLACALASETKVIVSGDRALQKVSGYAGIRVLSPRGFAEEFLRSE
jgi:putative PIN family toxin of toxin-antitoxin system